MIFAKHLTATLLFCLFSYYATAQVPERCGTVQYEQLRNPSYEKKVQFEEWVERRLTQKRKSGNQELQRTENTTYVIPVVVHVIHNGEAIGVGSNISDAQIQSQINVLNKDFQRLNFDQSNTPAEFLPVAGGIDIEFVLAKQDPFGVATNGIQRVQGTKPIWNINDNAIFKSLSYWPAEDYFNIWVINFSGYLGYAQFPVSDELDGLEEASFDRLTDGIIVDHSVFGSNGEGLGTFALDNRYNLGRTTTHEVGHFFGLRHIWGDANNCTATDYVADTPNQLRNYVGQCTPSNPISCGSNDMYMNYMDYTDDACMNLFSLGQLDRIITVLSNSPRRASLLLSSGATDPPPLPLDLSARSVLAPGLTNCGSSLVPVLEIQNLGSDEVTSAQITLTLDNVLIETKDVVLNLSNLQITTLSFQPVNPGSGTATFSFGIVLVNGVTDDKATNNTLVISSQAQPTGRLPLAEVFNSFPDNWAIQNPDGQHTWQLTSEAGNGGAIFINNFNYPNEGAIDRLITPVLDLTNADTAFLKFDHAYAPFSASLPDGLRVLVTTVCDFSNNPTVVFNKSGAALATAPQTSSFFIPNNSQWLTEIISLDQFIGSRIQIAFEALNGYGNNLYLDNIVVIGDEVVDLALLVVESPSPVSCVSNPNPIIRVKNLGTFRINSFTVETVVNMQFVSSQLISNLSLDIGEEAVVTLAPLNLADGLNTISFTLTQPNSLPDDNPSNNELNLKRVVNKATDVIPLREDFEGDFESQWTVISQQMQQEWNTSFTSSLKQNSMTFLARDQAGLGDESWLVSPTLDFSRVLKASLFFDLYYSYQAPGNEQLHVLYSTDCGLTFSDEVLLDLSGSDLSTGDSSNPSDDSEWSRNFINLNQLIGFENVRIAFVARADNGNDIYVDNIEFFIDDNPSPIAIEESFQVYGIASDTKITFNLTDRQPVQLIVYNTMGQVVLNNLLPETLNQTYSINLTTGSGIYIFKVQIGNQVGATKVFLGDR